MLLQSRIEFCLGTLLNCLGVLPEFKSANQFYLSFKDLYEISHGTFFSLFSCKASFLTKYTSSNKIPLFINAIMINLLCNRFYCNHDTEMAEFFFSDLKDTLNLNSDLITDECRQYLLNLMEWPTCAEIDVSEHHDISGFLSSERWREEWQKQFPHEAASESDHKFWFTCYYCYGKLLQQALRMPTINSIDFFQRYDKWLPEIKNANEHYQARFDLPKEMRSSLVHFLKSYMKEPIESIDTNKAPIKTDPGIRFDELKLILNGFKSNTPSISLRKNAKDLNAGSFLVTDPLGIKRRTDFQEIIVPQTGISLTSDKFDFIANKPQVDIKSKGIQSIAEQYDTLWLNTKINSARRSKYKPFSYRKVHIDSFYKKDISPGNDNIFAYNFELSPIEYFDHLIMREYYNAPDKAVEKRDIIANSNFCTDGFEDTSAFFFLAGCGVWVISKDNYLIVSRRGKLLEKPGDIGYSAAGSCEFNSRLQENSSIEKQEANPFITAARELYEECNLKIDANDLSLISFGIEYDRYLQQFSFYHQSNMLADDILEAALFAKSSNEQVLFAVPFTPDNITSLVNLFEMEYGAMVSLIRLWQWLNSIALS